MADIAELRQGFDALARAYPPGQHGRWAAYQRSDALDAWFIDALGDVGDGLAVLALGGYGRRLQLPSSDVDILLLHDGMDDETLEEIGRRVWYPLWDAGFAVTPLVRTPEECMRAAAERLDSRTALLDARRVCGSEPLARAALGPVVADVGADPVGLAARLIQERQRREERAGSCAYDLAPDLKDGLGGLRDISSLGWLAAALGAPLVTTSVIRAADVDAIDAAEEFLVRARSAVHLGTGKRVDRLSVDLQPEVASSMGFDDHPGLPAIDGLMRAVFEHARVVDAVVGAALARVHQGPGAPSTFALSGPAAALEALVTAHREIPPSLVDAIAVAAIEDPVVWDEATRDAFLAVLGGTGAAEALDALDRVGVLDRFLPAWRDVRCRPQRDPYHRFTVDGHLTRTLAGMDTLLGATDDPLGAELSEAIGDRNALRLGALLHDIGKVGAGDHVPLGAEIARAQLAAMGLPVHTAELAAFMVAEHLLLPDTATRRDLTDENLIMDVAATIGTLESLAALYLLAAADAKATGPAAWTPWRQALIRELVTKVRHVLERGTMGQELAASLTQRIEMVRQLLPGEPEADVDRFVLRMPRGYFLSVEPADAARHFRTIAPHLGSSELRTAAVAGARPGSAELLVVTLDRPGLLAAVAGALAVGGISILSAQVFTTSDHVAVDLFEVEGAFEPEITEQRWRGVRSTLRRVIEGATSIDRLVQDRRRHYPEPATRTAVTVRVDNEASDFSTVLEVGAPDRMGLLYDITTAFSALGIDVHLAKVATFEGRVVDAFYVRDELGRKLTDADDLAEVASALHGRLDGGPRP
jgi:[protein-PII] uridylyltransferase